MFYEIALMQRYVRAHGCVYDDGDRYGRSFARSMMLILTISLSYEPHEVMSSSISGLEVSTESSRSKIEHFAVCVMPDDWHEFFYDPLLVAIPFGYN